MWYYNNKSIESLDEIKKIMPNVFGFVYYLELRDKITNKIVYKYIGKKNLYSKTKKKFGKKMIASMTDKRAKKYEYVIKESDWKNYYSSNKFIKTNKTKFIIRRNILMFCDNETDLKYQEAKHIICSDALYDKMYLNDGVSLRMFGKKIID